MTTSSRLDTLCAPSSLGWLGIVRLGLVQTALGAIVVLMTSTVNRVMIVEIGLPAFVPGLLVAAHYAVQILRPAWGYGSDVGGRRTPWIVAGMGMLALGGTGAALATGMIPGHPVLGLGLAAASFLLLGVGAGAAGTSVLALLATSVAPERRPGAATTIWVMMILGFAVTAPLAGHFLEPFTPARLVVVTASVSAIAFVLAFGAIAGLEARLARDSATRRVPGSAAHVRFSSALRQVWDDPSARRFTLFIFISMLAYSAQELILDPFAGMVFAMTPGASTKLAGVQHGGVLVGMLAVGGIGTCLRGPRYASPRAWTAGGCVASALALAALALGGVVGPTFPIRVAVFVLGFCNGVFAVSAIGTMMELAGAGDGARAGTRMGLWGAAQAIAFAIGGFAGTLGVDVARRLTDVPARAYGAVFLAEALLFLASAALATSIGLGLARRRISEAGDRPVTAGI